MARSFARELLLDLANVLFWAVLLGAAALISLGPEPWRGLFR
jgi:hypothetical protein